MKILNYCLDPESHPRMFIQKMKTFNHDEFPMSPDKSCTYGKTKAYLCDIITGLINSAGESHCKSHKSNE